MFYTRVVSGRTALRMGNSWSRQMWPHRRDVSSVSADWIAIATQFEPYNINPGLINPKKGTPLINKPGFINPGLTLYACLFGLQLHRQHLDCQCHMRLWFSIPCRVVFPSKKVFHCTQYCFIDSIDLSIEPHIYNYNIIIFCYFYFYFIIIIDY